MSSRQSEPACYAGIGSRSAPADMLVLAQQAAEHLDERGWKLRTGHAPGMDQAFETGAGRNAEVYLPWPSFEHSEPLEADFIMDRPSPAAYGISAQHHPAWDTLSKGAKALHARNAHQILGRVLNDPVRFVVCWTPATGNRGGTGQAIRIAEAHDVPVYELRDNRVRERFEDMLSTATASR